MLIYICNNDTDSIFTAVSRAMASGLGPEHQKIIVSTPGEAVEMELFAEYIDVAADSHCAEEFADKLYKISWNVAETIMFACASDASDKADVVYHVYLKLLKFGPYYLKKLQDPDVGRIFELGRYVGNELHHFKGFLRFAETPEGILLAGFSPRADIVGMLMSHFSDRFPTEKIIITDLERKKASVYLPGQPIFVTTEVDGLIEAAAASSGDATKFAKMWREYTKTISIEERTNLNLQRNNMRLRFRENMTEFRSAYEKT